MLTHRACVANVVQQRAAVPFTADDRVLGVAPFFHATGFGVVANGVLDGGGTVITMPRFDIEQMLGLIESHRITAAVVVPPIVLALAKHPAVDRYDLSSLRFLACGAAPLGAELQQACARRLGCPVVQGYGMTELTAGVAIWPVDLPVRPGAAGRLLPGFEARVVDLGTGADVPPGAAGELWWRSPSAMSGYLGDPAATAATVDADGWLHSGDIGRIESDGALFVLDRVKELIKVKGFQVAPAELEAVLRTHPKISEAAVVSMPDERAGERPLGLRRTGGGAGRRGGDGLRRRAGGPAQAARRGPVHRRRAHVAGRQDAAPVAAGHARRTLGAMNNGRPSSR